MEEEEAGPPKRELYALLQVSPEATDEEIKKAYRHWAQVYHPDKYQDFHVIRFSFSSCFFLRKSFSSCQKSTTRVIG